MPITDEDTSDPLLALAHKYGEHALLYQLEPLVKGGDARIQILRGVLRKAVEAGSDVPASRFFDILSLAIAQAGGDPWDRISLAILELYGVNDGDKPSEPVPTLLDVSTEYCSDPAVLLAETKRRFFKCLAGHLRNCSDALAERIVDFFSSLPVASPPKGPRNLDVCIKALKEVNEEIPLARIRTLMLSIAFRYRPQEGHVAADEINRILWLGYARQTDPYEAARLLKMAPQEVIESGSASDAVGAYADRVRRVTVDAVSHVAANPSVGSETDKEQVHYCVRGDSSVAFYVIVTEERRLLGLEDLRMGLMRIGRAWRERHPGHSVDVYCIRSDSPFSSPKPVYLDPSRVISRDEVLTPGEKAVRRF